MKKIPAMKVWTIALMLPVLAVAAPGEPAGKTPAKQPTGASAAGRKVPTSRPVAVTRRAEPHSGRVSLSVPAGTPAKAVIGQLMEKTNGHVKPCLTLTDEHLSTPITAALNIRNQPYWEAVRLAAAAANLRIEAEPNGVELRPREPGAAPLSYRHVSINDRWLTVVRSLEIHRAVDFGWDGKSSQTMRVALKFLPDPSVLVDFTDAPLSLEKATDDLNTDLRDPSRKIEKIRLFGSEASADVELKLPSDRAKTIKLLSGRVRPKVAERYESFELSAPFQATQPVEKALPCGVVVRFEPVDPVEVPKEGTFLAWESRRFRVRLSGGDAKLLPAIHQATRLTLIDERGFPVGMAAPVEAWQHENGAYIVTLQMMAGAFDGNVRFVLDLPTSIREVDVPFTFTNIVLP